MEHTDQILVSTRHRCEVETIDASHITWSYAPPKDNSTPKDRSGHYTGVNCTFCSAVIAKGTEALVVREKRNGRIRAIHCSVGCERRGFFESRSSDQRGVYGVKLREDEDT